MLRLLCMLRLLRHCSLRLQQPLLYLLCVVLRMLRGLLALQLLLLKLFHSGHWRSCWLRLLWLRRRCRLLRQWLGL
jgi:hypothetical protein